MYLFILLRSLVDLRKRATVNVMMKNIMVDRMEVARFNWNQNCASPFSCKSSLAMERFKKVLKEDKACLSLGSERNL